MTFGHGKNEVGRLVPASFCFFKQALYEIKALFVFFLNKLYMK